MTCALASNTCSPANSGVRGQEAAVAAHRILDREAVAAADDVVLQAVPRRRVHRARAGIERHVVAENHRHLALVKRMPQHQMLERGALASPQ